MATKIPSMLFFFLLVLVIIISCLAESSLLSNTFMVENHNKLVSDGLYDESSAFFDMEEDDDHDDDDNDNVDLSHARLNRPSIEAVYQFGDSLSDTGNYIWENPYSSFGQSPYGETYFHKPTGRCSDGLLIIDYLAKFLNIPFLEPHLNKNGDFKHGANFAVIGATALNVSTLLAKNIIASVTNHSLSVQFDWFKSHLGSISSDTSGWERKLSKALFVVGEIGGNDYNFAIAGGKPPPFLYQMVPQVIETISNTIKEIISLGGTQIIVPANILMGCMPLYLTWFKSNDPTLYDELKCIKPMNEFAKFHNDKLRQAIKVLRKEYPCVTIVYVNLAKSMKKILRHPNKLGFDENAVYKTCCGIGDEEYNFNSSKICGIRGVSSCEYPEKHVNWDGFHLTSHAYQVMAKWLIKKSFDCTSTIH